MTLTIPKRKTASKPAYVVPTMDQIRSLPWNGYTVASTFAGGGGSSTGYRMAGFKVAYANEFIEAARDTYRANAGAHTVIDGRDIRAVTPEDVLDKIGMKRGELDVFDGSPPCASFSTAGKREKGWGKVKKYSDGAQRSDDLFFEFARLLEGIQPKVFVGENVSGLVKGTAKGYFKQIFARLESCGYVVQARLLNAAWLGVPQARERTIFIGVRKDLGLEPAFPRPLPYCYTIRDAIPWMTSFKKPTVLSGFGRGPLKERIDQPAQTIMTATLGAADDYTIEREADISRFAIGAEWDKLKPGEQSEKYFQLVRPDPDSPVGTITAEGGNSSLAGVTHPHERRKFSIAELRRLGSFPDDYVLLGSYQQQWERIGRAVPPLMMRAIAATIRDEILARIK